MNKILKSTLVITLVLSFGILATNAFFSDNETSSGNTLQAGKVDLLIANDSYYNGDPNPDTSWSAEEFEDQLFFDFQDLKPGDYGEDTISITVDDNDAWACMEFELTANDDNDCTEPELIDDPNCTEPGEGEGELGDLVNMVFWVDDGDNVLEDDEEESTIFIQDTALSALSSGIIPLADTSANSLFSNNLNSDGALIGGQTYQIAKAWCFGNLTPDPLVQDNGAEPNRSPSTTTGGIACDGSDLDNAAQTDLLLGDISFSAVQHRNNPDFLCDPLTCTPEEVWADSVVSNNQGTLKNDDPITDTNRTDPTEALGPPDWASGTGTNFYSLGDGGVLVVQFASPVGDIDGNDLSVHEATNGRPGYPEEKALVEISMDGSTWYSVGEASSEPTGVGDGDGISWFDISSTPLTTFQYVRITDTTNYGPHGSTADGFDLDAVDAQSICTSQEQQAP